MQSGNTVTIAKHTLFVTLPHEKLHIAGHKTMKQKIKQSVTLCAVIIMLLLVISLMPAQLPVHISKMPAANNSISTTSVSLALTTKSHKTGYAPGIQAAD